MNELENKVVESSKFYNDSFLKVDFKLAEYGFQTIKPFFRGNSALELGPASGYMTKNIVNEFASVHLVEGSSQLLNQIPDYENVIKFNSMFEDFNTDETFDTIIMSHVLEHISDPVFVLEKIKSWLKPDGVFIVAVPNAKSIHRLAAVQMELLDSEYTLNERDHQLGHYRVYDLNLLKEHVRQAGFDVIYSGGYFLKPVSNAQIENNWTEEMVEGFYKLGQQFQENCAEIFLVCSN